MQVLVSNIQKFSVDDGPGIRTTVFFKGCNLRCAWCHNPECIDAAPALQFAAGACTGCGRCAAVCPRGVHRITAEGVHELDRSLCIGCGACEKACRTQAIRCNGKKYTPQEVLQVILQDKEFYIDSGGGATFSGGEPMLQHAFLEEILPMCKAQGISTAVDTAGNVPYEWFQRILPYADHFLYDIKLFSPDLHRKYTGVDNARILENIRRLSADGADLIVRTPVIPGVNDSMEELEKIADLLAQVKPSLAQLLPYHSYGVGKYESYALPNPLGVLQPPPQSFMDAALQMFLDKGIHASF